MSESHNSAHLEDEPANKNHVSDDKKPNQNSNLKEDTNPETEFLPLMDDSVPPGDPTRVESAKQATDSMYSCIYLLLS